MPGKRTSGSAPTRDPRGDRPFTRDDRAKVREEERKRELERKKLEQRKRLAAKRRALALEVRAGKKTALQARGELQAAGLIPGGSSFKELKGPLAIPTKTIANLAEAGVYALPGAIEAGKAVGKDVLDARKGDLDFERTRELGKQTGLGIAQTFRHPLRRPGDTLLLGAAVASGGASAASRLSAAGKAAAAARTAGTSPTKAALTRPGWEGGSLLRRPVPEPRYRTTATGDKVRLGRYAQNPAWRGVQKGRDRLVTGETAKARALGHDIAQRRKVLDAAERAPENQLARAGQKLTGPQQMALRLWAENTPVDVAIAQHRANLAGRKVKLGTKGSEEQANLAYRISLMEAARPYLVDTPDGGVDIAAGFKTPRRKSLRKGASPAALRAVAERVDKVGSNRTDVLRQMGLLASDSAEFRVNAPGRMARGAQWKDAPLLVGDERRQVGGQHAIDFPTSGDRQVVVPPRKITKERPRALDEVQARIADIDKKLEKPLASLGSYLKQAEPQDHRKVGKRQSRQIEATDMRGRGSIMGAGIQGTPVENIGPAYKTGPTAARRAAERLDPTDQAYRKIRELIDKHPENETLQKFKALMDERDELASLITRNQDPDVAFGFKDASELPGYGTVTEETFTKPKRQWKRELRSKEIRHGRVLVGAEDAPAGRVRVPDVPVSRGRALVNPGLWRGGNPRKPGSVTHGYTGGLRKKGDYRTKTSALVAESGLEAQRYASIERLRADVAQFGHKTRPADTKTLKWDPVRLTPKLDKRTLEDLRRISGKAEQGIDLTPEERRVAQAAWDAYMEDIFPREALKTVGEGTHIPGVVWVPHQLVRSVNKHLGAGAWGLAGFDTFQNLVKTGVIVAKPGYVTANIIGNVVFNVIQQGIMAPGNWKRATRLGDELGPSVDDVMGSGAAQALLEGNPLGSLGKVMSSGSGKLNTVTDQVFRRAAFVHEARRFGYRDKAALKRLLTDKDAREDLVEIADRAKNAIVDYDRLGPRERDIVRRAIFIYPWMKGATVYGGHFLTEHPIQAAVGSQLANQAQQQERKDFGPLPAYARGSIKVGGSEKFPLGLNTAVISPVSQAAQIANMALSTTTGKQGLEDIGGALNPVMRAAITGAFKRDVDTGAELFGSTVGLAAAELKDAMAPVAFAKQLERADEPPGTRSFPITKGQAVGRFVAGSWFPRTYNREALNKRAAQALNLSPVERARRSVAEERQRVLRAVREHAPQTLENGKLRKEVRVAYSRKAAVDAARAKAEEDAKGSKLYTERFKLSAEAELAEKWGLVDKGFADEITARATETFSPTEIEKWRTKLRNAVFKDAYLNLVHQGEVFADYYEARTDAEGVSSGG